MTGLSSSVFMAHPAVVGMESTDDSFFDDRANVIRPNASGHEIIITKESS